MFGRIGVESRAVSGMYIVAEGLLAWEGHFQCELDAIGRGNQEMRMVNIVNESYL